jgi:hypothetical protein
MTIKDFSATLLSTALASAFAPALLGTLAPSASAARLNLIGHYDGGLGDASNEISTFDPGSRRLFITNSDDNSLDIVSLDDPTSPSWITRLSLANYGAGINSVAVNQGLLAVALESEPKTGPGSVAFFDVNGAFKQQVTVGSLPDMLTFTPDGKKVLVANEGEPNDDYTVDPLGSVSIIDVASYGVKTLDFAGVPIFGEGVRIFGPGATPEQDFEPEYIAVSPDGTRAFVALQENNALAVLDLIAEEFVKVVGLGFKDHSLTGNGLDASDRDEQINIQNWPVFGMFQPDAIATYEVDGQTYIVTANEGDARDYDGFAEEERVKDLALDPTAFPNADELQADEALGRLTVTTTLGDNDGDGDYDQLYAFGGRSFSIFDAHGNLVFDSGDDFEQIIAHQIPALFNAQENDPDEFDGRSDNKGPEPEGVTIGRVNGKPYAFIGLERTGGVMMYDISNPTAPKFMGYTPSEPQDISPEGLVFINAADNSRGVPLLITTNEVSGTTAIYEVVPEPGTVLGLISLGTCAGLGLRRRRQAQA